VCTLFTLRIEWWVEELLNLAIEVGGEFERELERWVIAVAFDRIDRLARDTDCIREIALADIFGLTVLSDVVFHEYWLSTYP